MKVGFIGLGRMGQAMARRLLDAGHDVGVYNRTPDKLKALADAGAKVVGSIAEAARYGDAVFTMLADDAALEDVATQEGGLLQSLPKGGIHICAGTHSVAVIRKLKAAHAKAGQIMIAAPDARPAGDGGVRPGRHRGRRAARGARRIASRCSRRSAGACSRRAPIRPPPRRSRSPTISCSAAPSRRWAKAFRWCANTASCRTCSTT